VSHEHEGARAHVLALLGIFFGTIGVFIAWMWSQFTPYLQPIAWYGGCFVAGFSLLIVLRSSYVMRTIERRTLQGLCPGCGYDLRASKDRCPECGMEIKDDSRD